MQNLPNFSALELLCVHNSLLVLVREKCQRNYLLIGCLGTRLVYFSIHPLSLAKSPLKPEGRKTRVYLHKLCYFGQDRSDRSDCGAILSGMDYKNEEEH
jgi:hypothetical protein